MVANKSWSSSAALVLLSFLPTPLLSQGTWSQTPVVGSPAQLVGHAAVYDMLRERMVLFGGANPFYAVQSATWEFDGVTWSQHTPTQSPPPRTGHAMAFDSLRGRVVLFGGAPSVLATSSLNDTWEFDGTDWIQRLAIPSPPGRMDHVMAYDMASNCCVLHGGRLNPQTPVADTWVWNGTIWAQRSGTGPSPRFQHALIFDIARARCVMFGGYNGTTTLGDTWEWDGTTWIQRATPSAPIARAGHSMAYDMTRSVTILHGGLNNGQETWEWDGATWTQQGSTNQPKAHHVLVYDSRHQRPTLFGGNIVTSPPTFIAEVETYGHMVPGSFVPLGTSCPGSTTPPQLFTPSSNPYGPMIGQTSVVQVTPTWFHTFFAFGWSDLFDGTTPLPHDLTSYGMPGCSLQVSRDAITSVIPVNGVATLSMQLANDPFLVGVRFYVQGFSLDLGANAGGFATTNRIEATIGRT